MDLSPLWRPAAVAGQFMPLDRDIDVDVAIVGAGITGLTLAWLLKDAGRKVAVLEMRSVGTGATGHTSGHLTAALDVSYPRLTSRFGEAGAREVASKSMTAISFIESLAMQRKIACDFRRVDGWRWGGESDRDHLDAERISAAEAGLDVGLAERGPLPFMGPALRFRHQARFHPVAWLHGLAHLVDGGNCRIYESTRVEKVTGGEPCRIDVGRHVVTAGTVVHATHTPIGVILPLQLRVAPYMTYVIGARIAAPLPPDLFWDMEEPYHYLRTATAPDGGEVLLIGGEDHKVGQEPDTVARFAALEAWTADRFPLAEVEWRWAWEVFEPVDGLPYIGKLSPHVFGATGFAGNGLTMGTIAALDIADQILATAGLRPSVMRPQRYKPMASAGRFLAENTNVAWRMVRDRLEKSEGKHAEEVPAGEGRILTIEGRKMAVYRTPEGRAHLLTAVCPHTGGIVHWNSAACTWDCPLHGSRFLPTGEVINGPATQPLGPAEHLKPGEEPSISDLVCDLQAAGYTCDLSISVADEVHCATHTRDAAAHTAHVERFQRFEGASDPDDMCVVVALRLPHSDATTCRGVVVVPFGPTATPEQKETFRHLRFEEGAAR